MGIIGDLIGSFVFIFIRDRAEEELTSISILASRARVAARVQTPRVIGILAREFRLLSKKCSQHTLIAAK